MFHFNTATRINSSMNGTIDRKTRVFGKMVPVCTTEWNTLTNYISEVRVNKRYCYYLGYFVSLLPLFYFLFSTPCAVITFCIHVYRLSNYNTMIPYTVFISFCLLEDGLVESFTCNFCVHYTQMHGDKVL